jgi:hypothetical protein
MGIASNGCARRILRGGCPLSSGSHNHGCLGSDCPSLRIMAAENLSSKAELAIER